MTANFTCEPAKTSPETCSFHKEIALMMHGFGDGSTPLTASVNAVESIVLKQLRTVLATALANAERCGRKCVNPEDIIFIMRKDKVKLKRMLTYMKTKNSIKNKTKVLDEQFIPNVLLEEDGETMKKRKRSYKEMIEAISEDDLDENSLDLDEISLARKIRANRISQSMSLEKYEAYHRARRASFGHGKLNFNKLKQWICPLNDINMAPQTLEVLSFLGYESVGQIVDLCFIVRQDVRNESFDPFARLEGGNYCNVSTYDGANLVKSGYGTNPITPSEVREAIRRFTSSVIGINGFSCKNIRGEMTMKFLAL